MLSVVLFLFMVQQALGVLHSLTTAEYDMIPNLLEIDEYEPCLRVPGDAYCLVGAHVSGNMSDPVYNTIVEFSENKITHFNHTNLRRGICIKKTCKQHLNVSSNLTNIAEACLNDSLTREYRLTAELYFAKCEVYEENYSKIDKSDYVFGGIVLVLLLLNLLGSAYDLCFGKNNNFGSRLLLCFSLRRNWARLAAPASSNPKMRRIKLIYCLKTITAFLIIMAHSVIPVVFISSHTKFLEESYHYPLYYVIYNGTLSVQTFFVLSGVLLSYNFLLSEEKRPATWKNFPKGLILRWLRLIHENVKKSRLTPTYALVLFYVSTWARHVSAGPFHEQSVGSEAEACRSDWWFHLLYIHNYIDHSQCMIHGWYLAADFQLSVVGLLVFCLIYSDRCRKMAIAVIVVVGLLSTAIETYIHDLYAILIVSPELVLNFFVEDSTFNHQYKRGHTNLVSYGLGLGIAYVFFNIKESELGAEKYKKYRLLQWMCFPLMLMVVFAGAVFYIDDIIVPLAVRVVYSSAVKLVFSLFLITFMFLTVVRIDKSLHSLLHWGGWVRLSRVTYTVYLVHVPVLRFFIGNNDTLFSLAKMMIAQNYFACLVLSMIIGVQLYLLVEAPTTEVVKILLMPPPRPEKEDTQKNRPVPTIQDVMASKETIELKL